MPNDIALLAVSALITTITSYLGAYIASRLALAQHTKQQSFNKRVEWHENAITTLYKAQNAIQACISDIAALNYESWYSDTDVVIEYVEELVQLLSLAGIYASENIAQAATTLRKNLHEYNVPSAKDIRYLTGTHLPAELKDVMPRRYAELQALLQEFEPKLIRDTRSLLRH
jgi:hypothetical protein